jgi:hypothetical protein
MLDVVDNTGADQDAPDPVELTTEAETKLTAEIAELWSLHRDNKAAVRRTRGEMKVLRQDLGEKLHQIKTILARTGRGGGWAPYLRSQKLPLATADRYVQEHEARLAPPANKLLTEELSAATEGDIHRR